MITLIALGNFGEEYVRTRHNVGWMFADFLQKELNLQPFTVQKRLLAEISKNPDLIVVKPQTFMNASGEAAQAVLHFYKEPAFAMASAGKEGRGKILNRSSDSRVRDDDLEDLFVVHDDLDIPIGSFKIQFGTGPKVHNGVNSIRQHLGTEQFWYVRIGIDGRNGVRNISGSTYVLQPFAADEQRVIIQSFPEVWNELKRAMITAATM